MQKEKIENYLKEELGDSMAVALILNVANRFEREGKKVSKTQIDGMIDEVRKYQKKFVKKRQDAGWDIYFDEQTKRVVMTENV